MDKLIHVNWNYSDGEQLTFTCLYAHNWVEKFALTPDRSSIQTRFRQFCEEECILYAGDVKRSQGTVEVVVAGTVFRSILVWNTQPLETQQVQGQVAPRASVLHRLQGHTGVIFDSRFMSGSFDIMSVSDDRSIRIWRLQDNSYKQEFEMYGHRSRVWAVRQTADMVASVSEDATCKLWSLSEGGKCFETLKGHTGKHVRALASFVNDSTDLLATGGEDGAIKLWDLAQMKQRKNKMQDQELGIQKQLRIPLPNGELPNFHDNAAAKTALQEYNKIRSLEIIYKDPTSE